MTTATRKMGRRHSVRPMASTRAVGTSSRARTSWAALSQGGVCADAGAGDERRGQAVGTDRSEPQGDVHPVPLARPGCVQVGFRLLSDRPIALRSTVPTVRIRTTMSNQSDQLDVEIVEAGALVHGGLVAS